jgi:DNA polymerase-3 subunit epsilon/oligoribonuclease
MLGIFLDQETSGLDSRRHRVLDFACVIVNLNSGKVVASYSSLIRPSEEVWKGRDPISITINGITFEEASTGKTEGEVAADVEELFVRFKIQRGKSVFICQNPSFDRQFFAQLIDPYTQERLFWPYHWLDLASMFWVTQVKKSIAEQRSIPAEIRLSKDMIAEVLGLPSEMRPHRALQGVKHLLLCYHCLVGFPTEQQHEG